MSRDKVEGFLIGLGAGVLFAAFMEFREELGKPDDDRRKHTAEALAEARERILPNANAHAATRA